MNIATSSGKPRYFFLLVIGLCSVLVGCSSSPSASDGERAIQNRIKSDSEGRIKLVKFRKTNGQLAEVMGIKLYALEFDVEIEFLENCRWISNAGEGTGFHTTELPSQPLSEAAQFTQDALNMVRGTMVAKDQRAQLLGMIRFEKKENGWEVQKIEITHANPVAASANSSQQVSENRPSTRPPLAAVATELHEKVKPPIANAAEVARAASEKCLNNLKEIGLAFRIWALDHSEQFPFNVSIQKGGTRELCALGNGGFDKNAFLHFQVMSNELNTAEILVCPSDSEKQPARGYRELLAANLSYELRSGVNISDTNPREILARCARHGHTLYCDGSVVKGNLQPEANKTFLQKYLQDNAVSSHSEIFREAEKQFLKRLEPSMTLNRFKETGSISPGSSNTTESWSFEASAEFAKDMALGGTPVRAGDSIVWEGIMNCEKHDGSWICRATSLRILDASNPSLLAKLKSAEAEDEARAIASARRNSCINNLRQIVAAKGQWALENSKSETATPTAEDLQPYLGMRGTITELPTCPENGTYSINPLGASPTCSFPGHSLR